MRQSHLSMFTTGLEGLRFTVPTQLSQTEKSRTEQNK